MSQAAYPILDADGHITESIEQVAKYLDAPYNRRPLNFSLLPVGRLGPAAPRHAGRHGGHRGRMAARARPGRHGAGGALSHARALPLLPQGPRVGGGALPRLQHVPARGVRQEEPAAARGRAAAGAGSRRGRARAAPRGDRARPGGRDARGRRQPPAGGRALPADLRGSGPPRRDAGHPRLRLAPGRRGRGPLPAVHPGPHLLARVRADAADHLDGLRGDPGALPPAAHRLSRGRLRLGALLGGADGRRVRQARLRGARAHPQAERLHPERVHLLLLRGRRVAAAAGAQAHRREPDRLRLRLPALGPQLSRLPRRDPRPGRHHRHSRSGRSSRTIRGGSTDSRGDAPPRLPSR